MQSMESKGSIYRFQNCACELLALDEDLIDDQEVPWDLIGSEISLKSTFLYCDLSKVISSAEDKYKQALTDLGNRLFYCLEEFGHAVKSQSISLTQLCYNDTAIALKEVMDALSTPSSD